jgi:cellulose synthase/poly-beta-1,6-N-acetylglucosamine synthase-like glycosyltransferase
MPAAASGEALMVWVEILFWLSFACVVYAYVAYPIVLEWLARITSRPTCLRRFTGSISIVIAAHNEEASLGRRLRELTDLIRMSGHEGEVILVSDGSTDRTAAIGQQHAQGGVRVLEMPTNRGKAAALTAGCAAARNELIIFADARQVWEPDSMVLLLENFADPQVGAVSGDLVLARAPGVLAGVGLYWRYEKWIRRNESAVYSTVGVTGAISAVRRALFRPIPKGTVLDDVYWPLQVALQGFRVVHDSRARAHDLLPDRVRGEFNRKLRTLSGNYQLLGLLPAALLPWHNPVWFQYLSHKLLRLVVPWALLGMLGMSLLLPGPVYKVALGAQVLFYGLAFAGMWRWAASQSRVLSSASAFLVLNAAAWLAFWVWLAGGAARSWQKAIYQESSPFGMDSQHQQTAGSPLRGHRQDAAASP